MVGTEPRTSVYEYIPSLTDTLKELVRYKSISAHPDSPLRQTAQRVAELFRQAGLPSATVRYIEHKGKESAPLVYANEQPHRDRPTVLLYAHYDVQPAEEPWTNNREPFEPAEETSGTDTRLYGRGAADDKAGIVMHLGAIQAARKIHGQLPVNVKLVIEGEEETGTSVLDSYLDENPSDRDYQADVIVVADTGNIAVGKPTLTTTLRGIVVVELTVETLKNSVHSGMYGGPAPDAFMALANILATLHDDDGNVAVPGLGVTTGRWQSIDEATFRERAGMLDGVQLIGSGPIEQRLYGKPSINVVGLDGLPKVKDSTNALCPKTTARISVRLAPDQDPAAAHKAVEKHLKSVIPWNVRYTIKPVGNGKGFVAHRGDHANAVRQAFTDAYPGASEVGETGQGGSIPLVSAFRKANPKADIALWGCEEPLANIHGIDESVSYAELENMTQAEINLLYQLSRFRS